MSMQKCNSLLRGLRASKMRKKYGVSGEAFMPDPKTLSIRRTKGLSSDAEASINWEDDFGAIENLSKSANAKYGIVRLDEIHKIFDFISGREALSGVLSVERAELSGNPYHGNLLFSESAQDKWFKVASLLATLATDVESYAETDQQLDHHLT